MRRLLRLNAGLSQEDVAQVLGVSRPAVTRYESGAREPRSPYRLRYVDLLGRLAKEAIQDGDPAATPGLPTPADRDGEDGFQG
jgi:transcriptional regulator with XRE-family HTH domain